MRIFARTVLLLACFTVNLTKIQAVAWDWSKINLQDPYFFENLRFPASFVFGVADSAYQTEGHEGPGGKLFANNWTSFEQEHNLIGAGRGCERWTKYPEDIALMGQCGFKLYRFSVEWSKIEPEPGVFNQEALDHYKDVCKKLLQQGITPKVCLFHHTWPCWFGDLGGFEKKANIKHFLRYSERVVRELSPYVKHWMTFNEPEGYAMQGYARAKYPPAKKSMKLAGEVLKNMLRAHVELYFRIKKYSPDSFVGFAKIVQPVEAYAWYNPLDHAACAVANRLMDGCILEFFSTGIFNWSIAGFQKITHQDSRAPQTLDYLGINYYTHTWLKNFGPAAKETEVKSDDGKAVYPEGIYYSLKKFAQLGLPLYVAENGVADAQDNLRADYIKRHLYAVSKAYHEGVNILGYCYWTFMDCHEWGKQRTDNILHDEQSYPQCYGLVHVDRKTQKRTLREGAREFVSYVQKHAKK